MMINYKNIQSVADELLNLRSLESNKKMQEAYSRSAVSRAYYATFHIARNKMEKIKRKSNPKYTDSERWGSSWGNTKILEKRI